MTFRPLSIGYNNWPLHFPDEKCNWFRPQPWGLWLEVTFDYVHLKRNKFEANHPFVKFHLTKRYLLFGNQNKNNWNVFYLDLIWNGFDIYENVWLNCLKCISMFELKRFMKMIIPYISYLEAWMKIFDPWNYINISNWVLSSSAFVVNFSGTLSSGEKWWLEWKFWLY